MKKTMVLVGMATALMALALPAMSSAEWSKNTKALTTSDVVTFSGGASFVGGLGGVSCTETHSNTLVKPGTTGEVETFTAVPASCKGSGGLAFCTVVSVTSTAQPWTAHQNTEDITITGVNIDNTYTGAFCPYHEINLTGNITVTALTNADKHHAKEVTIEGSLTAFNNTNVPKTHIQTVIAHGILKVTPSGVYGLTPTP